MCNLCHSNVDFVRVFDCHSCKPPFQIDERGHEKWPVEVLLIPDVSPFTHYAVFVSTLIIKEGIAASSGVEGAESDIVYVLTPEDFPDSPRDVSVSHLNYSSVNITWIPPLNPNGKTVNDTCQHLSIDN